MKARTRRDLTIVEGIYGCCTGTQGTIGPPGTIVIACDSCGAVGEKDGDVLKLPTEHTATFTARVALTEVMCSGATPITITCGASNEMEPTGKAFIAAINKELANAGLSGTILTGSTEENFQTCMTALSVTVIGVAQDGELRFGQACGGDVILLIGRPDVGAEVDLTSPGFYNEIKQLLKLPGVREIVPVGSKGVEYEAGGLAALNNMNIRYKETGVDYKKSAGPATCLLVLCSPDEEENIIGIYPNGLNIASII